MLVLSCSFVSVCMWRYWDTILGDERFNDKKSCEHIVQKHSIQNIESKNYRNPFKVLSQNVASNLIYTNFSELINLNSP